MMNLDVYKSGTARYSSKFYLMLIKNLFYFSSLYCFKLGIAPQIEDLYGKVQFTGNVRIIHHYKSPSDHHKCWSQRITMVLTFLFHILQFLQNLSSSVNYLIKNIINTYKLKLSCSHCLKKSKLINNK